jgi:hypothetical protein
MIGDAGEDVGEPDLWELGRPPSAKPGKPPSIIRRKSQNPQFLAPHFAIPTGGSLQYFVSTKT